MIADIERYAESNYFIQQGEYAGQLIQLDRSPWLRPILRAFADPRIHQVTVYKGTQSGGSIAAEICVSFTFDQFPQNIIYNVEQKDKSREFGERALPAIEKIPSIKCRISQRLMGNIVRLTLKLPNVWFKIQHATKSNAQSDTAGIVINDEAWLFDPGRLKDFLNRTGSFRNWTEMNVSSGGDEDSEIDLRYIDGTQGEYAFRCQNPECGELFMPLFGKRAKKYYGRYVFRFDEPPPEFWENAKGAIKKEEIAATVKCHCPHCDHAHEDKPAIRKAMARGGDYIYMNPDAASWSGRFSRFVPDWNKWSELVALWLNAMRLARRGFTKELEDFVRKVLAESWREHSSIDVADIVGLGDFEHGTKWIDHETEEEVKHNLSATIDVQKDHLWVMVCAWAEGYRCRILEYVKASDWDAAEALIVDQYGITNGLFVAADRSYEPDIVGSECAKRGWMTFMGEDRKDGYVWKEKNGRSLVKPYARPKKILVGEGTARSRQRIKVERMDWSNNQIKDGANKLMRGHESCSGSLEISDAYTQWGNSSEDFVAQMDSEEKYLEVNEKTGARKLIWRPKKGITPNNHAWDCFCMQVVMAWRMGVI